MKAYILLKLDFVISLIEINLYCTPFSRFIIMLFDIIKEVRAYQNEYYFNNIMTIHLKQNVHLENNVHKFINREIYY